MILSSKFVLEVNLYGLLVSIYCLLLWFNGFLLCIYMLKIVKKLLWGGRWGMWKSARNFERSKEILFIYIIITIYMQEKGKEKVGMSLEVVVIKSCLELWCYKSTSFYWFWCKITKKEDKYGLFKENILETFLIFCFISWTVTSFVCSWTLWELSMRLGFFDVSLHGRWQSFL